MTALIDLLGSTLLNRELNSKHGLLQFSEEKDQDFESVKFKQQDVSSEVLVTATDVKCNFT